VKIKDAKEGMAALESGKADACAGDRVVLFEQVAKFQGSGPFRDVE